MGKWRFSGIEIVYGVKPVRDKYSDQGSAPSTMFVRTPCTSGARSYDGLTPSKLKRVKDLA